MKDTLLVNARTPIKPGDLVIVNYPMHEQTSNPARRLNGEQFVVKKRKVICTRPANRVYFELYGAKSKAGVPYAFLEEELIKI